MQYFNNSVVFQIWHQFKPTFFLQISANHIEVGDLATLSEEDLRTLVPCIGPRNRIKRHIAKLVESNNNNSKQSVNSDQGEFNDLLLHMVHLFMYTIGVSL